MTVEFKDAGLIIHLHLFPFKQRPGIVQSVLSLKERLKMKEMKMSLCSPAA